MWRNVNTYREIRVNSAKSTRQAAARDHRPEGGHVQPRDRLSVAGAVTAQNNVLGEIAFGNVTFFFTLPYLAVCGSHFIFQRNAWKQTELLIKKQICFY